MKNTLENEMFDAAVSWCCSNGINVLEPEQLASLVNSLYITVRDADPTPANLVLVPLRPTRAMQDIFQQGDWQWADVLAAAESVTEEQYLFALEDDKQAQPERAPLYSLDTDSQDIRARTVHAVLGALALGANNENKPPSGHWLTEIWDIARAEREGAVDRVTTLFENCETPYLPDIARAIDGVAHGIKQAQPERAPLSDADCTRIYNEANDITDKNPPITTQRIFAAMRAAHDIKQGGQ